jgi:hypothetical protein
MTIGLPQYGLKAYALLFAKHGTNGLFRQSELDWIVSSSMKKKIFSILLRYGWINKHSSGEYSCTSPVDAIRGLMEFRVPKIMLVSKKSYAFTKNSAIELWSDYSYILRGIEKSPYFIKVLGEDLKYWKEFFNKNEIPNYVESGSTIGEYVILIPVKSLTFDEKDELKVDTLKETMKYAKLNDIYEYASAYMRKKYGET